MNDGLRSNVSWSCGWKDETKHVCCMLSSEELKLQDNISFELRCPSAH